jgi:hypothetical protein
MRLARFDGHGNRNWQSIRRHKCFTMPRPGLAVMNTSLSAPAAVPVMPLPNGRRDAESPSYPQPASAVLPAGTKNPHRRANVARPRSKRFARFEHTIVTNPQEALTILGPAKRAAAVDKARPAGAGASCRRTR